MSEEKGSPVEREYMTYSQRTHGSAAGWPLGREDNYDKELAAWCDSQGVSLIIPDVQVTRRARLHVLWSPGESDPWMDASLVDQLLKAFDEGIKDVVIMSPGYESDGRYWHLQLVQYHHRGDKHE